MMQFLDWLFPIEVEALRHSFHNTMFGSHIHYLDFYRWPDSVGDPGLSIVPSGHTIDSSTRQHIEDPMV
jgi:hypothetical protein